jgi:hypothetical protein
MRRGQNKLECLCSAALHQNNSVDYRIRLELAPDRSGCDALMACNYNYKGGGDDAGAKLFAWDDGRLDA